MHRNLKELLFHPFLPKSRIQSVSTRHMKWAFWFLQWDIASGWYFSIGFYIWVGGGGLTLYSGERKKDLRQRWNFNRFCTCRGYQSCHHFNIINIQFNSLEWNLMSTFLSLISILESIDLIWVILFIIYMHG